MGYVFCTSFCCAIVYYTKFSLRWYVVSGLLVVNSIQTRVLEVLSFDIYTSSDVEVYGWVLYRRNKPDIRIAGWFGIVIHALRHLGLLKPHFAL